nr:IS1380 family transposase [Georgenia muralis]
MRHGGMGRVFDGVRAPSTLGTFLRSFTHGHVQQLDKVSGALLAGLARQVPALVNSGARAQGIAFVDVDDTIREVHGYAKQAAAYGYSGVRGLNVQLATLSTEVAAPVIVRARLRRGNVASHTGAGQLLAQALGTARAAGVSGPVLCRADSAYYGHAFVATALRHGVWFSVTVRMNPQAKAAIAGIGEDAWTPIRYPHAVWDEAEQRWVSDAEVAEVPFVAFTSRRKAEQVTCRLIVRRVRRLQPLAGDGSEQGELFATYRHHAFITNSDLDTIEADQRHRGHAIVEQVIAELKDGPLAHLPSGKYAANAAWVAMATIAFNIARAAAVAADMATARWATLRRKIINVPARIATTGRRLILHLPARWAWAEHWTTLHTAATGPPPATTT